MVVKEGVAVGVQEWHQELRWFTGEMREKASTKETERENGKGRLRESQKDTV